VCPQPHNVRRRYQTSNLSVTTFALPPTLIGGISPLNFTWNFGDRNAKPGQAIYNSISSGHVSRNSAFYIPESIAFSKEHVKPGADLFLPSNFSSFYTKDLSSSNSRPLRRCDSWRILVPDISPLSCSVWRNIAFYTRKTCGSEGSRISIVQGIFSYTSKLPQESIFCF
jgi:hypothetical protein